MRRIPISLAMLMLVAFVAASPVHAGNAYYDPIYGYSVTSDIVYGYAPTPGGTIALLCDIYQPTDIGQGPVPTNRPAVVIQDGGAWTSGSKTNGRVVHPARYICQRGFTVIITDYRYWDVGYYLGGFTGGTEFGSRPYSGLDFPWYLSVFPGEEVIRCGIEDFSVAMAWVRDNAAWLGIDANKICACGGSAGGIDVLCNQYNNNPVPARYAAQAVMCVVSTMYENWDRINAGGPPAFMLNNTADPVIWYSPDVPNFNNRLTQLGIYHEQWFQETQVNHDFDYNEIIDGVPIMERMKDFCCFHLAGGPLQVGYTLTLAVNPSGTGTITTVPLPRGDGTFEAGTVVTLTANPGTGYGFTNWSGGASGSSNPTTVTMNAHKSVTANMAPRYTLSLASNPPGGGTVDAVPPPDGDGKYAAGTLVTVTAIANAGYVFSNWTGSVSGTDNPLTITMNANHGAIAEFAAFRPSLTLAVGPVGSGSITASPSPGGDGKYAYGTVVTLTANPADGFLFSNWSQDASGSSNPTTVTLDGNKSVTGNFVDGQTLTLSVVNDTWGTITVEPNLPLYAPGAAVTLTATPIEGKLFREWMIWSNPSLYPDANYAVADTNPILQLTMDHDYAVEAAFKCGSGMGEALPVLMIGFAVIGFVSRRLWRRS